jgi:hypothetical protein
MKQQGKNDKLLEIWLKLERIYPQDPNVQASVKNIEILFKEKIDTSKTKIKRLLNLCTIPPAPSLTKRRGVKVSFRSPSLFKRGIRVFKCFVFINFHSLTPQIKL